MENPTIQLPPENSKKRMFAGSSSSSFPEPDLIEIPPPASWKSKPQRKKSIVDCELIVLDSEEPDDVVIIDEKIAPNAKGKKPMHDYFSADKAPSKDGAHFTSMKDCMQGGSSSHVSFIDDDFDFDVMDLSKNLYDSDCEMLQAHFDAVDIPSGVEATVPWWPFSSGLGEQSVAASGSTVIKKSNSTVDTSEVDKYESLSKSKPLSVKKKSTSKKAFHGPKHPFSGPLANLSSHVPAYSYKWPTVPVMGPDFVVDSVPFGSKQFPGWPNASHPVDSADSFISHVAASNPPTGFLYDDMQGSRFNDPVRIDDGISSQISPPVSLGQEDSNVSSIVKKLELFKKFDTLEDHSDHLFVNTKQSAGKSKGSWFSKIMDEWKMLERDLPGTIFVRVYEARIDLLRAVIVGADGTPYHDGLFFFDVNFPPTYPHKAPSVKYHAHGLRINPNLYNDGKVCLSLLGTWRGSGVENWQPGKSTMLQVLLSIQGLILNAEPYYNEPGYESSKGSHHGRQQAKHYSENTFLLSLKTMLYTMRNPPKHFEDLVFGHFYTRAHDVLAACRAYLDGAEVGSYDKSKSTGQSLPATGSKCSNLLKTNLPNYIKSLVEAFAKIGVKDCEKFLVPVEKVVNQPTQGGSSSHGKSKFLSPMAPWNVVYGAELEMQHW